MSKISNCIKMIQILRANGIVKAEEIAERLEVEKRQIHNYKNELEKAGIFIRSITGKDGGYYLDERTFLDKLCLTDHELTAIIRAKDYVESKGDFLYDKEFHAAVDRVINANRKIDVADTSGVYINNRKELMKGTKDKYDKIKLSIGSKNKLKITYKSLKGETTERIIQPYELFNYLGSWYCIAFCEMKMAIRDFKLSRIDNLVEVREKYEIPSKFDLRAYIGSNSIFNDEHFIKLKVSVPQAVIVSESVWGREQKINWIDEKTIMFEAYMQGKYEIVNWVLGMGVCIEVIEPEYIRNELKEIIGEINKKYQ